TGAGLPANQPNILVTCGGHTGTTQFTGCTPAMPINATAPVTLTPGYMSSVNTGTIGGFIKIERQDTTGVWSDVTMEILNYGIANKNIDGFPCGDPTQNAILRLQRLRDNGDPGACNYTASLSSYDYWPNVMFDTREGNVRDVNPGNTNLTLT